MTVREACQQCEMDLSTGYTFIRKLRNSFMDSQMNHNSNRPENMLLDDLFARFQDLQIREHTHDVIAFNSSA
ncbi:hypothetical protein [Parasitella parasitica]|uniref:Uncharacterized protein n=1 Tax=Parasitella parasitica TaxID=35722 RepID=A0A0B7NE16_9FUNG|nr:hypothetical protein [Parasitella parasitica]